MQNTIIAKFPAALIARAIKLRGNGMSRVLWDEYGYSRAKKMSASVTCIMQDMPQVHCGEHPIIGWVGLDYQSRVCRITSGAYINSKGGFCFPG